MLEALGPRGGTAPAGSQEVAPEAGISLPAARGEGVGLWEGLRPPEEIGWNPRGGRGGGLPVGGRKPFGARSPAGCVTGWVFSSLVTAAQPVRALRRV